MSIFTEVPELVQLYPFGVEHSTTIETLQKDFNDIKPYGVSYFEKNHWIYLWVFGTHDVSFFYKMPVNYWSQQSWRILNWEEAKIHRWQKDGF